MSRSKKKPILKDKRCRSYWKTVRRVISNKVRMLSRDDDTLIPNNKEIINDYDYRDYTVDFTSAKWLRKDNEHLFRDMIEKAKRK